MLESIAACMAASGVFFTARKRIIGWPLSLLASFCYFWIFLQQRLYADVAFQAIFACSVVNGWIHWIRERSHCQEERVKSDVESQEAHIPSLLKHVFCTLLFNSIIYYALFHWSDDPAPFLDSTLSCGATLAQYWTARRYRICWILWIIVDSLYVILFYERHLYQTMVLFIVYVLLSFYGYAQWKPPSSTYNEEEDLSFNKGG